MRRGDTIVAECQLRAEPNHRRDVHGVFMTTIERVLREGVSVESAAAPSLVVGVHSFPNQEMGECTLQQAVGPGPHRRSRALLAVRMGKCGAPC